MITFLSPLAAVRAQQAEPLLSPWVLAVLFILLAALFIWLLLRWSASRSVKQAPVEAVLPEKLAPETLAAPEKLAAAPVTLAPVELAAEPVTLAPEKLAETLPVEIPAEPVAFSAPPETVVTAPEPAPVAVDPAAAPVVDNLEIIEGIGPKIAGVLKQAGITSFAHLAALSPELIAQILQTGGIRLADPHTWPEQARLAASGDQAALKALQDRLKGGREIAR